MTTAPAPQQYDLVADAYDRLIRPRYEPVADLVVERLRELTDVRRAEVLELSAGTGALTHRLAPLCRRYVATDVSEPMLAVARAYDVPGAERVTWLGADVRELPLESASTDAVVSSLGPFQDSEQALGEARRVLRPGGILAAVTWGDDYRELQLLQEARRRLGLPPRETTDAARLSARLSAVGYRHLSVREVRLPAVHASVDDYLAYRQAFGPVRDLVTPDADATLRTLADCAGAYTDAEGRVVLDSHLLVMSGTR